MLEENKRLTIWLDPDMFTEGACPQCGEMLKSKYGSISNREWLNRESKRIGNCVLGEYRGKLALYKVQGMLKVELSFIAAKTLLDIIYRFNMDFDDEITTMAIRALEESIKRVEKGGVDE